uniref:Uncharacterized protein n=1 Tax=Oryza meridionalis TaxID=40149 RepID=A0A0E0C1H7_9ORYZ
MDIDTSEEATPSPSAGSASILKLNFCCHAPSTQQYDLSSIITDRSANNCRAVLNVLANGMSTQAPLM